MHTTTVTILIQARLAQGYLCINKKQLMSQPLINISQTRIIYAQAAHLRILQLQAKHG